MAVWQDNVRKVTPYVPGEQPDKKDIIKLNTNENPYPPSPLVQDVIRTFDRDILRKYPDPDVKALREALARYHGLDISQVFVGVGSDDVLAMCFMTFFNGDLPVLFPDITYSFYDVWAELLHIPYRTCPLSEDFSVDPGDYRIPNGGIIIANPNAPTGMTLDITAIEGILSASPESMVIIDEAYVDFGTESAAKLIGRYDNILVCRTFSKSRSLAGSRIGYALGSREAISCLFSVRNSFNSYTMDSLSIAVGVASVRDEEYFRSTIDRIVDTRERSVSRLREMGFSCTDSRANFLFVSHPQKSAEDLFRALRDRDIYVRYFKRPRIDNYLRITVGTDGEMDRLFSQLEEILQKE